MMLEILWDFFKGFVIVAIGFMLLFSAALIYCILTI